MPFLHSVNLARPQPNPYKRDTMATGIGKEPVLGPVLVRAPGPKRGGLGSGLVGDFVGDRRHHGGDGQAVYAFAREDLDAWQLRLGRELPNGFFGENFTTGGIDVADARLGERWRVGAEVVVEVTSPRIPCSTFRGWIGQQGWLRDFTADARPGAYLKVVVPGSVQSGDLLDVVHRPDHDISVAVAFRASTVERSLLPRLLEVGADLDPELRVAAEAFLRA